LGSVPKQHAIWLAMIKNSVALPFSIFVGSMKPVIMAFFPLQPFTSAGIWSSPVGGVFLASATGS